MLRNILQRSWSNLNKRNFTSSVTHCDALVLGGGIAGASVSYQLAKLHDLKVICLEKENSPGYHATGKAFGIFAESNARSIQSKLLTSLSRPFFESPDSECFDDYIRDNFQQGILTQTGLLAISSTEDYPYLYQHFGPSSERIKFVENIKVLPQTDVIKMVPFLNTENRETTMAPYAIYEPQAANFNTGLVYEQFLIGGHNKGVEYYFNETAVEINKNNSSGNWNVLCYNAETNSIDRFEAGLLINACGQWTDDIAEKAGISPINLITHKRNVIVFTFSKNKQETSSKYGLPFLETVDSETNEQQTPWIGWISPDSQEIFHSCFQGNNGIFLYDKLLDDGKNNHESHVNHDEMEIVLHKIAKHTSLKVEKVASRSAGIKCSVEQDSNMVIGPSTEDSSFIFVAALSGYGIQTSPAYSELCSYLCVNSKIPQRFDDIGIDVKQLLPSRLNQDMNYKQ